MVLSFAAPTADIVPNLVSKMNSSAGRKAVGEIISVLDKLLEAESI